LGVERRKGQPEIDKLAVLIHSAWKWSHNVNAVSIVQTQLYRKCLGCLLGGIIGDAVGTPTEGMDYRDIEKRLGWVEDFSCDGTDDTVMKNLLAEALIRTDGYATLDDWAQVWLDHWDAIFGSKLAKFFASVTHTAQKLKRHTTPRMAALGSMPSSSSAMCISPVGIVNACNPVQAARQAYDLASLIHIHDVGHCQDGAAAMAAAVAEAMSPKATVESIVAAAHAAIIELSGRQMLDRTDATLELARRSRGYEAFRHAVYASQIGSSVASPATRWRLYHSRWLSSTWRMGMSPSR
jgi:ADP-ribosylglycohydrolase